tara:strand:- start:260 stop:2692 length:2433 start_codon:yes stop_codon:yes gene_type:complete
MTPKGNWDDPNTTETPEDETLFGVAIKVYPNDEARNYINPKTEKKDPQWARVNWFNLNGKTYQYQKGTHAKIPKKPYGEDPEARALKETDSWEDYIIAVGEMYYGAIYDPETKKFKRVPRVIPLNTYQLIVENMKNKVGIKMKNNTPYGYGKDSVDKAIAITKILDMSKEAKTDVSFAESQATKKTKIEKLNRKNFLISEPMEQWRKRSRREGTSVTKLDAHEKNLYRFMVITGTTGDPQQFTVRWKNKNKGDKVIELKKFMTRFKHWAMTYETPPEWFDELHESGLTLETGEFAGETLDWDVTSQNVEGTLGDIWKKEKPRREWVEGITGSASVKAVVDAIRNFVKFSEPDSWTVPDQKDPSSVLSARVKDPTKAHLGQDLSDEQIQIGMKFLETGKRWKWIESGFKEIKIEDDFGNTKTQKIPNRIMVEDETDTDPHYNSSLRIYKKWGSPYGRTAPANMFFRLALSGTGWRKAEALTMANKEISKGTVSEEKSGFYFKKGQDADAPEVLKVVFQTRKTERLGAKYAQHTSSIPPMSSELIDSKHTIELVMEKNGHYRYDETGKRIEIPANERKTKSKVMIGQDDQFIPVDLIKVKTGGELTKGWIGKQLTAYIYVPLKEMYAIMRDGTGVTIRDQAEITELRKEDIADAKTKKKLFPMNEYGWALSPNKSQEFLNEEGRMSQDSLRWNDPEKYWIGRPLHSVRHIFAQAWLRKSDWNFGLVSLVGHWKIMDVLKLHYGERPDDVALKQMIDLFAKSDDKAQEKRTKKALQQSLSLEDAQQTKEETTTLSASEKKAILGSDGEGEDVI